MANRLYRVYIPLENSPIASSFAVARKWLITILGSS